MGEAIHLEAGTILAAWPDMLDPHFMHSVVLVCQHSEEGAYGIVTNRPTELTLRDLLPEHELLENSEFPVHLGGPVDHATMQFVHAVPDRIPGGIAIEDQLFLGGDLDALGVFLREDFERARGVVRVFLGYSGWGASQLDQELETGSWLLASPSLGAVFGPEGEGTWRRVVRSTGQEGEDLQNHPPDVSWN